MFIKSKYKKWYDNIISHAQNRASRRIDANKILGYSERHHIIPKCMGGSNDSSNLAYLSAREHFICHLLLIKFVEFEFRRKMQFALGKFIQSSKLQNRKFTSRQYDIIRKSISSARIGIKRSDEIRKKISEGHKGQVPWNQGLSLPPISSEHKELLSDLYNGKSFEERFGDNSDIIKNRISSSKIGKPSGMLGKFHSEETKEKNEKAKTGRFWYKN